MYKLEQDNKNKSIQKFLDVTTKKYYLNEILNNKLNQNKAIKILKDLGIQVVPLR